MSTTYNALAAAITREENSTYPNNPGGLMDSTGKTPLTFSSESEGLQALLDKLQFDASGNSKVYSPSMTLADFESKYTGGNTNAANNIASILGIDSSTPLSALTDQALGGSTLGGSTKGDTTQSDSYLNSLVKSESGGIANIVSILVGAILIAGAVFGFSQVRDTVIATAKTGAQLAASA